MHFVGLDRSIIIIIIIVVIITATKRRNYETKLQFKCPSENNMQIKQAFEVIWQMPHSRVLSPGVAANSLEFTRSSPSRNSFPIGSAICTALSSSMWPTDRQTDHATSDICSSRPHWRTGYVRRCGLIIIAFRNYDSHKGQNNDSLANDNAGDLSYRLSSWLSVWSSSRRT